MGTVPLDRCVLVVADRTDAPYLERTLREALERLPAAAPNTGAASTTCPSTGSMSGAGAREA